MSERSGNLLVATLVSLTLAGIILVTVVLPAEFDVDPLGTGSLLGLTGLSRGGPTAVTGEDEPFRSDRIAFELAPFESVEYKYRIEQDGGMVFSWMATGEVVFDLHAEPDGADPGYAESFEQGRGESRSGTYVAPFPGIHGWFWENRGMQPVTVELAASGYFHHAIEFRDGDQSRRELGAAGAAAGGADVGVRVAAGSARDSR